MKEQTKFQRWKHAVKNASPYRLAVIRRDASLGNVIGLFCGIVFLIAISIINKTINFIWLFFFIPFIWVLQVVNLISANQNLEQIRKVKEMIEKQEKGGDKNGN